MKSIALFIIVLIFANNINAQSTAYYNKALKGKWEGAIEGTTTRILELYITTVNCKLAGNGKINGYSKVEGTNKTYFSGTIELVDGYFEIELKEIGNKSTNGVFLLSINISDLDEKYYNRKLEGNWTSNKTKKLKTVNLTKNSE